MTNFRRQRFYFSRLFFFSPARGLFFPEFFFFFAGKGQCFTTPFGSYSKNFPLLVYIMDHEFGKHSETWVTIVMFFAALEIRVDVSLDLPNFDFFCLDCSVWYSHFLLLPSITWLTKVPALICNCLIPSYMRLNHEPNRSHEIKNVNLLINKIYFQ